MSTSETGISKWLTERHSTLLPTKELQVKTAMRYSYTPTRMAKIIKTSDTSVGKDYITKRDIDTITLENHLAVSNKIKNVTYDYTPKRNSCMSI